MLSIWAKLEFHDNRVMTLHWVEKEGVEVATPRDDITISVRKWSKMWGWIIERRDSVVLARGVADSVEEAEEAAGVAWHDIETGSSGIQLSPTPYDRRLSADWLTYLQRRMPSKD